MSDELKAGKVVRIGDGVTLILADSETHERIVADAVVTDPPYGMNYRPQDWKKWNGTPQAWKPIEGDDKPFEPARWLVYPIVAMWGASYYMSKLPTGKTLVWDKRCHPDGDKMFGASIEVGWCNRGNGEAEIKRLLHGGVVNADSEKGNNAVRLHPTQKPVGLMMWTIEQAGVPVGATVLDPYMGSGTTGLAAIRTGRKFIGIERDPIHFATAEQRIRRELEAGTFDFAAQPASASQQPLL
jgi:DNA modification methylase